MNFVFKTVTTKHDMIVAKYYHSLCKYANTIFSIGGYGGSKCINECEKYDTKSDIWSPLPNLIEARYICVALNFKNEWIYALCGNNGSAMNKVERLRI